MDYQRHYDALINRARCRVLPGYVERHHVLPRCLGGGDEPSNLVALTPEEHFVAHQLLVKLHPGNSKLIFAALAMTRGRAGNKRYGWLRRKFSEEIGSIWRGVKRAPFTDEHRRKIALAQIGRVRGPHSDEHRARLSVAHAGKQLSADHIEKLAEAKRGKAQSPETIAKRAASNTGKRRKFSEAHKAAIGEAMRGRTRGPYASVECPNCGLVGAGGSMRRWHFENCKVASP